jgi:aspartate-semialdehyde dehydrogenase
LASVIPKPRTIALVGSESLIGREVRDVFETAKFPAALKLVASGEDEAGLLTEYKGEPALVGRLDAESLAGANAVILAGSRDSAKKVLDLELALPVIDLTYAGEERPRARLRAPMIEGRDFEAQTGAVHVVANPAAIALAVVLARLHAAHSIQRAVVHVFEPASERGKSGLDEMQQQTVNLLSFKGLGKDVYDAQAAFNMLAEFGDEAPERLEDVELRMERHLASLLAGSLAPMPSLRLVQAPVFHGHSMSLWVEFEENPGVPEVERALEGEHVDLRGGDQEAPNAVGITGGAEVALGGVRLDRNHPQAVWIWAAADNLRLMAVNAAMVARRVL